MTTLALVQDTHHCTIVLIITGILCVIYSIERNGAAFTFGDTLSFLPSNYSSRLTRNLENKRTSDFQVWVKFKNNINTILMNIYEILWQVPTNHLITWPARWTFILLDLWWIEKCDITCIISMIILLCVLCVLLGIFIVFVQWLDLCSCVGDLDISVSLLVFLLVFFWFFCRSDIEIMILSLPYGSVYLNSWLSFCYCVFVSVNLSVWLLCSEIVSWLCMDYVSLY